MFNDEDGVSNLHNAIEGFEPNELEALQDIIAGLSTTDPQVQALRRIAAQSLAHVTGEGPSQENRQQLVVAPNQPSSDITKASNDGDHRSDNLKIEDSDQAVAPTPGGSGTQPRCVKAPTTPKLDPSSLPKLEGPKICLVCSCEKDVRIYRKILVCSNCRSFFKRTCKDKKRLQCSKDDDCEIIYRPKSKSLCASCRLKKALDLGLLYTDRGRDETPERESSESPPPRTSPRPPRRAASSNVRANPEQVDMDEDLELQLALEASLVTYSTDCEWQEARALVNSQIDLENSYRRRVSEDTEDENNTEIGSNNNSQVLEELGLHSDIFNSYSRWFYGDIESEFGPGSKKEKSRQEEVGPKGQDTVVVYSNQIGDELTFLSEDLDVEEPTPIEEIVTPVITIRPSDELLRAHEANSSGNAQDRNSSLQPLRAGDVARRRSRPELTLTLSTHRTTIDRRPMLKRLKTSSCITNRSQYDNSSGVTSTSLIGPGEDCDDSDDNEIDEIDCDNT